MLCALLLLQSGCSALRLGYGQAPELAYWWLDARTDLDDVQSPRLRAQLADFFAWHRQTQLPDYAALLERWRAELPANTTPEKACAAWGEVRRRIDGATERALPGAAELALTLSPGQLRHLERHDAEANAKFRDEFLQRDPARRLREAVKRTLERIEMAYGSLDDTQEALVTQWVARSPYDPEAALAERERRQQDLQATLRKLAADRADKAQAVVALRAYAQRAASSPREKVRAYADTLLQYNCEFVAAVHNATTPAQRDAAAQRLKGWEGDFRALAAAANGR